MSDRNALATTEDVAAYLGVPPRTVEMWRYRGIGPRFVKLPRRRVRYRWSDVERYLDSQQSGPEAA